MDKKKLFRAAAVAFGAQGVTAAASALTVFLLAGRLDAASYGLWQLFVLAGGYSGLFHLGLCDGVYLRCGGIRYNELDLPRLGAMLRSMMWLQLAVSAVLIAFVLTFAEGGRAGALTAALLYMPVFNASAYLGYVLQASGRTVVYSASVMLDRAAFVLLALAASVSGVRDFMMYTVISIIAKLISLFYCLHKTRELAFAKRPRGGVIGTAIRDIGVGSKLMLANLSGQMVSGAARLAIILRFGDAEFGRISFVMTLSGMFLQLASQISMVLFPSLRREDGETRKRIFSRMRSAAGMLLPAALLAYVPVKVLIGAVLPQYEPGLKYLALLLPLCLFDGKTQLVGTTCMKVNRREGQMLTINLASAGVSLVLCTGAAYLYGSIGGVLISAVTASALRSVICDLYCMRDMGTADIFPSVAEILLCAVFTLTAVSLPDIPAAVIFAGAYMLYVYLRREEFGRLLPAARVRNTRIEP